LFPSFRQRPKFPDHCHQYTQYNHSMHSIV
jgi:hypothetical protein